jgi:hypothetical protein
VPLFEHTSVRPRRSASALPPAHHAYRPPRGSRTYYRPCSSITGKRSSTTQASSQQYSSTRRGLCLALLFALLLGGEAIVRAPDAVATHNATIGAAAEMPCCTDYCDTHECWCAIWGCHDCPGCPSGWQWAGCCNIAHGHGCACSQPVSLLVTAPLARVCTVCVTSRVLTPPLPPRTTGSSEPSHASQHITGPADCLNPNECGECRPGHNGECPAKL